MNGSRSQTIFWEKHNTNKNKQSYFCQFPTTNNLLIILSLTLRSTWTSSVCDNWRCVGRKCGSGLDSSKRQWQRPNNRLHHSKGRQEDNGSRGFQIKSCEKHFYTIPMQIFTCLTALFRNGSRALSTTTAPASPSQSWWLGTSTSSGSSQRTCVAWVKLLPKPKRVLSSLKRVKLTVMLVTECVGVCSSFVYEMRKKVFLIVAYGDVIGCKECFLWAINNLLVKL